MGTAHVLLVLRRRAVEEYQTQDFAWASINAKAGWHRPGIDISLPPPITDFHALVRHEALSDSNTDKAPKYLLTFKGRFEAAPARAALGRLHNASAGVVVVNSNNGGGVEWDYAELLARSLYSAAVRGDNHVRRTGGRGSAGQGRASLCPRIVGPRPPARAPSGGTAGARSKSGWSARWLIPPPPGPSLVHPPGRPLRLLCSSPTGGQRSSAPARCPF